MTISLLVTVAILVIGGVLIWLVVVSLGRKPSAPPPPSAAEEPVLAFDDALNLYLAAPERLPAGAGRVELSLTKAVLVRADGLEVPFFDGSRRLMLQPGVTEKILSERIPDGRWTRLKLTFSPVADLAFADGRPVASAILERGTAVLSFDAEFPVSRTLALFARLPLEEASGTAGDVATISLSPEPRPAESFVFGGFLLDARDRGDLWTIASPSLAAAVKEDLGVDITRQLSGSSGFVPASGAPSAPQP